MNTISTRVQPTRRKHVALYSSDVALREQIAGRLDALAIYDVHVDASEAFLNSVRGDERPNVVILDVDDGQLLANPAILAARSARGAAPLIAISSELKPEHMRNLVRLNAADWLRKPVQIKELINAVTVQDSGERGVKSRITTFISASGGAGATTMALSAAAYLAQRSPQKAAATCLVDLDFQSANCGSYLNLVNEFELNSIVTQPERLDVELLDVIKLTHEPGFTIYSFERPGLPFDPNAAEFVFRLLDLVAYHFEEVVIDLPNLETPWQHSVLSTSDEIFIVFELNIASLRQAKRLHKRVRELRGNNANVTFVANKQKRKWFGNIFSRGELRKIFKVSTVRAVALDSELLTDALNRAMLASEIQPRARFNKDVKRIFRERLDAKPD